MDTEFDIGIVGLGYVGLTLATVMGEVGFRVLGVEKRSDVVEQTNAGKPHFSETGIDVALQRVVRNGKLVARETFGSSSCKIYIITVGTPLSPDGTARLDMIEAAARQVAENMSDGALVLLRSTVKIGTTRNVVAPILAKSGKSFDIAMCPERTLEGKALVELRELPQIIGADSPEVRDRAAAVFRRLTSTVVQVASPETAEIIKLVDNTYRDVQFAFANEVARACEAFGVNAHEVIMSGKLGYQRTNVPLPGLVGGPCLEKDPHILFQSVRTKGVELEITRSSRLVNERQPFETADFIIAEMDRRAMTPTADIAIAGLAFKGVPATDDLRGSMSLKVLQALKEKRPHLRIRLFDPVIEPAELERQMPGYPVSSTLTEATTGVSVVIIANNHPELGIKQPADLEALMDKNGFIYDYWNHFSNLTPAELGNSYFAVGNTKAVI